MQELHRRVRVAHEEKTTMLQDCDHGDFVQEKTVLLEQICSLQAQLESATRSIVLLKENLETELVRQTLSMFLASRSRMRV